jgi:hypothetical protein
MEAYEDGTLQWNSPAAGFTSDCAAWSFTPPALRLAEVMQQMGLFTLPGLKAASEIWAALEYREKEDHHDAAVLMGRLLERAQAEGLILGSAADDHVSTLYRDWQIPCTTWISGSSPSRSTS